MSASEGTGRMLVISFTNSDVDAADIDGERFYVTGTSRDLRRVRVWMGPNSYRSLLDAVRRDGTIWCNVPPEQEAPPAPDTRPAPAAAGDTSGEDPQDEEDEDEWHGPVDEPGSLAGTVVLVAVGENDQECERLFVIPESWACCDLRRYAVLTHARSYRDVLADDDAVQTVVEALDRSLRDPGEVYDPWEPVEDLGGRKLFDQRAAAGEPFDAHEFFGHGGWRQWVPDGRQDTAGFLKSKAPALWNRFRRGDGGWGIDYDPVEMLYCGDEEQILAELRKLGCEIIRCPGLSEQYWNPDPDLVARIDAGEWPPKPDTV